MSKIITIAREYGSGGRLIAQKVAEKLGLVYYDNQIIDLQESCIIVNGCADYILEDYDQVLKVFIHAPFDSRCKRVEEMYKEDEGDVRKKVKTMDKKRANYYNYYTTNKWGNLKNFDLTINSDFGLDETADIIVEMYNRL